MFFTKDVTFDKPTKLTVYCNGKGHVNIGGICYPVNREIELPEGEHRLRIKVINIKGLPSIYINSDALITDETWGCYPSSSHKWPENIKRVGCEPKYTRASDNVEQFPFLYERLEIQAKESIEGGTLYDFGSETYANIKLKNTNPKEKISVYFGESKEEAIDHEYTLLYYHLTGKKSYTLEGIAFRFMHIITESGAELEFEVDYEYLPLEDKGSFECENPMIKDVFSVCSKTLNLNSRAFFLDGIKRDHWVWSGDSYQTFFMNYYLTGDKAITERTLIALLGKPPYIQHINAINDYSSYLIFSILDYYKFSGNIEFLKEVYDRVKMLYNFIVSRLDKNGFVVEHPGDWVFIDWADFDREGPQAAMQIVLWQTHNAMAELAKIMGECTKCYEKAANTLKKNIDKFFWCKEKKAYIDSFVSGKKNVTRHANIFAVLYGFADSKKTKYIIENVFKNDSVPAVTTPYFKLYELWALCEVGEVAFAAEYIDSYWGGMVRLGATTMWETFNPNEKGIEHYRMYGGKYDRSLCHAWGAGPVFLLGKYVLGVNVFSNDKYKFTVSPNTSIYKSFKGTAPLGDGGVVQVEYSGGKLTIKTTSEGGAVVLNNKEFALKTNEKFEMQI